MDIAAIIIIMLIGAVIIFVFYVIGLYNKILDARNRVYMKFEQIDIELNKILNLIPSLIKNVEKNVKHEDRILGSVNEVRKSILNVKDINEKIGVMSFLFESLDKVFGLQVCYFELKKEKDFVNYLNKINKMKDKINYASSFYNEEVSNYNDKLKEFPLNIVSKVFKFREMKTCNIDNK